VGMAQTKTNADTPIGTPAIIVRRKLSDIIASGNLRPGQTLPGKDIVLVTVREPTSRRGKLLGRNLAFFGAPENLPGEARIFHRNVAAIGDLVSWHDHDGWKFDPQRYGTPIYETGRFKGYEDGSAIGKWGAPELPLLNGEDRYGNTVNPDQNMLALSRNQKSAFYGTFVTAGSFDAWWSHACTQRGRGAYVRTVHFPSGKVHWDKDNVPSCVRPVVALELNSLVL
jgi:hypothetical protein